jgi:hypothetical protein
VKPWIDGLVQEAERGLIQREDARYVGALQQTGEQLSERVVESLVATYVNLLRAFIKIRKN